MVTHHEQSGSRFGPAPDYLRCFLLVFVPYAPLVPSLWFWTFLFFSGKECRATADRWNEKNERINATMLRLRKTLHAELPNAEPQLPSASCMVGVLNVK